MENLSFVVEESQSGSRLDAFLAGKEGVPSRSFAQKLIDDGMVRVNGRNTRSSHRLQPGDSVAVTLPEPIPLDIIPEELPLDIVYEDSWIAVINKSRGMVVHPAAGNYSGTLVNALLARCGDLSQIGGVIRPGIVHRLDKDTSGLLVVAKTNEAHLRLASQIKDRNVKRRYLTIVHGRLSHDAGTIDAPIGRHRTDRKKMAVVDEGRKAVTHFKVLERFRDNTYLEALLETGRTHQIRVHMAYIGHPVVGDPVYGSKKPRFEIAGQALHAAELAFDHPQTGQRMRFEVDIPCDMKKILELLRLDKDK